jgi:hypothetical protein
MTAKQLRKTNSTQKGDVLYVLIDVIMIVILPLTCSMTEKWVMHVATNWMLLGKWFVFWAFGFRLFTSGIKQASDPSFAVKKSNNDLIEIVRKLGIANICLGTGGILSLINESWRQVIAILGCLFFGLDAIRCLTVGLSSAAQKLLMLFNVVMFVAFLLYVIYVFNSF